MATTTTTKRVIIHDRSRVAAPPTAGKAVAEQSIPLSYFDMMWLYFHPIQRLLFYPFPCSKTHFLEHIVPRLKQSLSKTLIHYLPLSGNLLYPLDLDNMPEFRYIPGDSVSLTIAEANKASDFSYLTGNQAREANQFYAFIPDLPDPETENKSGFKKFPLLAIQVTLFQETGICMGFTNHHAIGDASSIVGFIKAWSSAARLGENDEFFIDDHLIPIYDRSVFHDPSGRRAKIFWNQMKNFQFGSAKSNFPNNKLRGTFILQKNDIQKLKNLVLARKPGLVHLSSFTVTTAYVWTCLIKSGEKSGEETDEDEPEYFGVAVDVRNRVEPPVPRAYFGNCVAFVLAKSKHGALKSHEGFFTAVELVGEVISKQANKDEILRDADDWLVKFGPLIGKRLFAVAGSPRFDLYDTDFGWGKPVKYESVSIDGERSMSLSKSKEFEGGLEIGLSLIKGQMDAFADIFYDGLKT